jgi:hypothetical protein
MMHNERRAVDVMVGEHFLTAEYEIVPDEPLAGLHGGIELVWVEHCCGTRRRPLAHYDEPRLRLVSDLLCAACERDYEALMDARDQERP